MKGLDSATPARRWRWPRRPWHWAVSALAAFVVMAVVAEIARADSGSISIPIEIGGGEVQTTFNVAHDTCIPGVLGEPDRSWHPAAFYFDGHVPCPVNPWGSPNTSGSWFGGFHRSPGTETGADTFFPLGKSKRLCLYVERGNLSVVLLAQTVYTPPIPDLTMRDAKLHARAALAEEFGGAYRHGNASRLGRCARLSRLRVRCRPSWGAGDVSYRGWVLISNASGEDGSTVPSYRYRIKQTNYYCVNRRREGDRTFRGRPCTRVHTGKGEVG